MSVSGQEVIPEVQEGSEDPLACQGVVERPSRRSGSSREALLDVREWLGDLPGCP